MSPFDSWTRETKRSHGSKKDERIRPAGSDKQAPSSREKRHREKKEEVRATFENLMAIIDGPRFKDGIEPESMRAFLGSLYYYSAGDRTKPIHLPRPRGVPRGANMTVFGEGVKIKTRVSEAEVTDLATLYGRLRVPDLDAVSSIVSFNDDTQSVYSRTGDGQGNGLEQVRRVRNSGFMQFGGRNADANTRLSTPMGQPIPERNLRTNADNGGLFMD